MSITGSDTDSLHLARAIQLAEGGRGQVSPNPLVGAVLAHGEQVIGEGFHRALGSPHAEVEAIRAADGHDLGGATLYVSLPPGPDAAVHGRDRYRRDPPPGRSLR
jgi:diaminohydroxyphosphoribosylaminopyrimidine deaminase/5-amino-6-(5-phosphoribosylamino)uracil reductase